MNNHLKRNEIKPSVGLLSKVAFVLFFVAFFQSAHALTSSDRSAFAESKEARAEKQIVQVNTVLAENGVATVQQTPQKITGTVTDAFGEPVIGASIVVQGTSVGTATGIDGTFTLNASEGATLVFTYVGYITQKVTYKNQPVINVVLLEDLKTLEEVVVVGYGTQKKVNLSGAVATLSGDVIAAKPATDALSAMQGEMPGVAVLRSSGQPGSETSGMRIRGFSSVNDTKTLVLIDGVEGDITLINPQDIESVSVLKDAASAAIYGARAAAGVVLVTTKSGKSGKTKISYNGYFGVNTPGNMPQRLPAWEEQRFINESRVNTAGSPEWNDEMSSWIGNPNFNYRPNNTNGRWDFFQATNWVEEGTKDYTTQQSHAVSVSGGSNTTSYLLSSNYYAKDGLLKFGPDKNERFNFRLKFDTEFNKYLGFSANINYDGKFIESNPYNAPDILERLYHVRGRQPILNPEEDINQNPYNGDLQQNAIDIMKNGGVNNNKYESYVGKGTLTLQNFVKGLRINLSASRKAGYYTQEIDKPTLTWYDRLGTGIRFQINNPNSVEKKKNSDTHDLFEGTAYYTINLNKKNTIDLLGGASYENYRKDEIDAIARNLNSNNFFSFNYYDSSLATNTTISDNIEPWSMMSYFGRVNYNYDNRYLLEANVRYDGSSRLAPDYRWKAFPSFSAAWRINEEHWFNVDAVSNLKVRASWGELGNGAVLGLYDYLALISSGTQIGSGYYYQDIMASQNKTWETIETTNIGLDLGFLNNKLTATFDYYWKNNNDMLAPINPPSQIGIKTPFANVGKLKTWGWEFEIGWKDKIKDLKYQVSFNISDSENELVKYNGLNVISAGSIKLLQGYPMNTIWGYKTDGYWSSRQEYLDYKAAHPGYESFQNGNISGGDVKYVAAGNPDHKIGAGGGTPDNPGDLVNLGNSNGRYLYGINLNMQWRNFDFAIMFQGVAKREMLIQAGTLAPLSQTAFMPWTIHRDYWTPDNQDAYWPRLYNYNNGELFNYFSSDKWVQDASYIRLKNLAIGYTIPINRKYIDRMRISFSGEDIWEHSNLLSVFDPETGNNTDAKYYPFFRTWTMGLSITF